MKRIKVGIVLTLTVLLLSMLLIPYNKANAQTGELTLGLLLYRQSGKGYIVGASSATSEYAEKVWKIASFDAEGNANYSKSIYCLDAGKGFTFTTSEDVSDTATYTSSNNMLTDRQTIKTFLDASQMLNGTTENGKDETYNKILWIIDHMYVPITDSNLSQEEINSLNEAQKNALFTNAGISDSDIHPTLTDDLIDVVQQLAIWYYTDGNYEKELSTGNTRYPYNSSSGHTIYEGIKDQTFVSLEDKGTAPDSYNTLQDSANALYTYLINNANGEYTGTDNSSSYSTTATVWTNEGNSNQPVVVIERTPKQFDLSLRKRITKINETNLAVDRAMANTSGAFYAEEGEASSKIRNITINTTKLDNLADDNAQDYKTTTAEYKHRKDPVIVNTGDKVTYTITVYNEGEIDGRAIEVTDQLPTGLKFLKEETENTYASEGYSYIYNEDTNRIVIRESLVHDNLSAYTKNGTLSYAEIHVICEVVEEKDDDSKVLTNVAWISEDSTDDSVVDRDSQTTNSPDVNKDNMSNYKGTTTETDLSQDLYYPGQQDDDDFDKLILPSRDKIFDLALRKYITEIKTTADDGTTSITKIDGTTNTRTPNVDETTLETGTTATYKHRKDPVLVRTGDLVTYNITIYNEGEKAGRATKIIDQLPTGLTFNSEETLKLNENTGYTFTYDTENNKVIITETDASTHTNLEAYNTETKEIDSKTLKVVCTVTEVPSDKEKILTNIAYISEEYNAEDNLTITNQRYSENKYADRDSEPSKAPNKTATELNTTNIGYTGKNIYTKNELENSNNYYEGAQDDDDFEKVKLLPSEYDLALRKFITEINSQGTIKSITNRIPDVDTSTIATTGTATYNHTKEPLTVRIGDIVTYTIRVYNEGGLDAYASEITDHLPEWLEFITQDNAKTDAEKEAADFNINYLWEVSVDGRTVTTNIASKEKSDVYSTLTGIEREETLLTAFDGGESLDYLDVQIKCKVKDVVSGMKITNIADITEMENKAGDKILEDRDSETDNVVLPNDNDLPNYKDDEIGKEYVPGQEDDDDFEKVVVQIFDLALRKFITAVDDTAITTRYPKASYDQEEEKIKYTHPKDPVGVSNGNLVTYTIRVYNEGDIAGYATEVTDNLPEGLLYLPDNQINEKYRWKMIDKDGNETLNVEEAVYITTDYLSKAQEDETGRDNLLGAFNKKAVISDTNPDYRDIKVVFEVIEPNTSERILINTAQISQDEDENGNSIDDIDSIPNNDEEYNFDNETENEDDIDIEKVKLLYFDLALRKFITAVNDENVTTRVPELSYDEENKKIKYSHPKDPVEVANSDIVTYTIRIYNEGTKNGYADEVTDDMPEGLEFLPENSVNKEYRWKMIDKDGKETTDVSKAVKITTDYLSKAQEDETGRKNLINAFDKEQEMTGTNPDYKDLKVAFKVIEPNNSDKILINTAEISEDKDENGKPVEDIDSIPGNDKDGEDDIDKEYIKLKCFDLALRKFITAVDSTNINNRYPSLSLDENGNIVYTHTKVPVDVESGNIVTYTIRVYNEGEINGYADEVTDDMPEGLEFLPENSVNEEYRWKMIDKDGKETTDVSKAVKITTDYLSKAQEDETGRKNLINAFDKEQGITETNPDYKDLKVAFKVIEPNTSDRILVNTAQISEDKDGNGNPVEDIDSTPGNDKDGEDDIDKEYVKVKYFDLALKKWVSQAIVIDGKDKTVIDSGHTGDENPEPAVKVDLKEKKLNSITVKFVYQIKVTNEGQIAGYAKEVKDHIPAGLEFVKEDNPDWYECEDGKVATAKLANTLLQPGESATVSIVLKWINNSENMGQKMNYAEISKDYNESNTPDIDSTPNNFKEKPVEDDEDEAPVLLSIQTGTVVVYIGLIAMVLVTLSIGIVLIKKYVL